MHRRDAQGGSRGGIPEQDPELGSRGGIAKQDPEAGSRGGIAKQDPELGSRGGIQRWYPDAGSRGGLQKQYAEAGSICGIQKDRLSDSLLNQSEAEQPLALQLVLWSFLKAAPNACFLPLVGRISGSLWSDLTV